MRIPHLIKTIPPVLILVLGLAAGCEPGESDYTKFTGLTTNDQIRIASFNIENMGLTKTTDPVILPIIANIIRNFDIVAIQEVSDITEQAMVNVQNEVNKAGNYSYILGPRLGTEQYAFIYRNSTIELLTGQYTYGGGTSGDFVRDPFIAHFKTRNGNFDFALVTVHTVPDSTGYPNTPTAAEIGHLTDVMTDAATTFSESDVICLGDFNGDDTNPSTKYYNEDNYLTDFPSPTYIWMIPNTADTTVAASSNTYDRIVATSAVAEDYIGTGWTDFHNEWGVFRFDYAYNLTTYPAPDDISDHYPVYAVFYVDQDTD